MIQLDVGRHTIVEAGHLLPNLYVIWVFGARMPRLTLMLEFDVVLHDMLDGSADRVMIFDTINTTRMPADPISV